MKATLFPYIDKALPKGNKWGQGKEERKANNLTYLGVGCT